MSSDTADPAAPGQPRSDGPDGLGRPGGLVPPPTLSGRFGICDVQPSVESGRRPAKAVVGELVTIAAEVFREGARLRREAELTI